MHCTKRITADMLWVGADDRRLAVFEGVYGVPDGVSYNSYLINDEKTILFDTVDKAVGVMKESGVQAKVEREDKDDGVLLHILIPNCKK